MLIMVAYGIAAATLLVICSLVSYKHGKQVGEFKQDAEWRAAQRATNLRWSREIAALEQRKKASTVEFKS